MTVEQRLKYLRILLVLLGITGLGLYPLMVIWPAGWAWHEGIVNYQMMLVGVYATLGVFLLLAARDPMANLSLIWFTVWSSVVHAGVMTVQALTEPGHMGHFVGDIPLLLIGAAVLAALTPRRIAAVS